MAVINTCSFDHVLQCMPDVRTKKHQSLCFAGWLLGYSSDCSVTHHSHRCSYGHADMYMASDAMHQHVCACETLRLFKSTTPGFQTICVTDDDEWTLLSKTVQDLLE